MIENGNTQVQEQLREKLEAQAAPQGWHVVRIEEQELNARHFYLGVCPEKKSEVYAVYAVAFAHAGYPGFLHCCKVYVLKDGRAQPLEWWGGYH